MRGNPSLDKLKPAETWSIPASAGQPIASIGATTLHKVYPRECGATMETTNESSPGVGLSPRVRGNQVLAGFSLPSERSIPASAGQPCEGGAAPWCLGVYPRECGATIEGGFDLVEEVGLSPRVRGNHVWVVDPEDGHGSIPASAGQPLVFRLRASAE